MERRKSLELHLTEAELETLINAVRSASDGRLADLEFKLRAAWRKGKRCFGPTFYDAG